MLQCRQEDNSSARGVVVVFAAVVNDYSPDRNHILKTSWALRLSLSELLSFLFIMLLHTPQPQWYCSHHITLVKHRIVVIDAIKTQYKALSNLWKKIKSQQRRRWLKTDEKQKVNSLNTIKYTFAFSFWVIPILLLNEQREQNLVSSKLKVLCLKLLDVKQT